MRGGRGRGRGRDPRFRHRGGRGGPGRPTVPPGARPETPSHDPLVFWRAGAGLDFVADGKTPVPQPGVTLRRLGSPPDGGGDTDVEESLRKTWTAAAAAASALLRR